jgi:hypothetical protein
MVLVMLSTSHLTGDLTLTGQPAQQALYPLLGNSASLRRLR